MTTNDTIQLMEDAVKHLLPPYANEDDMYEALDKCALTERQIYDEMDRRCGTAVCTMSEHELAHVAREILFEAFTDALATATAHKVPLYV